ncbi:MAG TPA: SMP-30/gluconolactonase/LRE family protein [Chthoniobacterales bacterium]
MVERVIAAGNQLGESPVWKADEGALYWVDIPKGLLSRHVFTTGGNSQWKLPASIGSFAFRSKGGMVVALKTGIYFFNPDSGDLRQIHNPEAELAENRFNEGKCDPRGRFFTGTMNEVTRGKPDGSLYRLDSQGELNTILQQITVPNGLAWSPDGSTMYFADTRRHVIFQFDYDIDDGIPSRQRTFVDLSSYEGLPDGATVDADGCLWSAMFSGGRIVRYTPKGKIDRVIGLPVTQVNSLAFGGSDLRTLFIVTSKHLLNEGGLAAQPLAGDVFAMDPGVAGMAEPSFSG